MFEHYYKNLPPTLSRSEQQTATVDELFHGNIKLALHIVGNFSFDKSDDAVQEALIGLLKAAKRYKPSKGSFSTYASYWIKNKVRMHNERNHLIHVPAYLRDKRCTSHKNRQLAIDTMKGMFSINDTSVLEDGFDIPDEEQKDPEQKHLGQELSRMLTVVMSKSLNEREQYIISRRFNLGDTGDGRMTLDELGKKFNLSRERIRQIEAKALKKLRTKLSLALNK